MSALPDSIWFNAIKQVDKYGTVTFNIPCPSDPDSIKQIKDWLKNKKHRSSPGLRDKLAPIKYQYKPKVTSLRVTIAVHNYLLRTLETSQL